MPQKYRAGYAGRLQSGLQQLMVLLAELPFVQCRLSVETAHEQQRQPQPVWRLSLSAVYISCALQHPDA